MKKTRNFDRWHIQEQSSRSYFHSDWNLLIEIPYPPVDTGMKELSQDSPTCHVARNEMLFCHERKIRWSLHPGWRHELMWLRRYAVEIIALILRLARPPGNCVIISGGGAGSCALANETGWQVAHIKEGSLETGGESGWASLPVRRGCGPPQDTQAGGGLGEEIGRSVCAGPRNERAASLVGKKASFARLVFLLQRNNRERERERHSSEGDSRSLKVFLAPLLSFIFRTDKKAGGRTSLFVVTLDFPWLNLLILANCDHDDQDGVDIHHIKEILNQLC
ncbi:hypothetical protein Fcan01_28371 [Folsomia candida]|uniref:Uncharacterized protein n=1 Tax=Folsomia candida TaxID=158441 RepID=A0A226CVR3_FOLCA|nr:hypothetical protein Fcan01_28371 [Folsomia candida]